METSASIVHAVAKPGRHRGMGLHEAARVVNILLLTWRSPVLNSVTVEFQRRTISARDVTLRQIWPSCTPRYSLRGVSGFQVTGTGLATPNQLLKGAALGSRVAFSGANLAAEGM